MKTKTTMAIITLENEEKRYIEENKIKAATFGDFYFCNWSYEEMGLKEIGENEKGEILFSSSNYDFEGKKTWKELENMGTDWYAVSYWDGTNYNIEVFEYYATKFAIIDQKYNIENSNSFNFDIILENQKFEAFQSNISGNFSPFYALS